MIIAKKARFDAAHYIPNYPGPCSQLHGHSWEVEVAIEGEVIEDTGMIVDFSKLSSWLEDEVISVFDHTYLNGKFDNPTAETLALWIEAVFASNYYLISADIKLAWIKVWETPTSMVMLKGR